MSGGAIAAVTAGNVVAGAAVATVDAARRRWRSRWRPGHDVPVGDWIVGDAAVVSSVLTALGQLRRACLDQDVAPPPLHAVLVGHERVIVRLSQPTAVPHLIPGWQPESGDPAGLSWVVDAADLRKPERAEAAGGAYPLLVPVGTCDAWTVLVNLGDADGVLGVGGESRPAQRLLLALAFRLVCSPWSRHVEVVLGGLPAPVVPEPGRLRVHPTPEQAVADAAARDEDRPTVLLLASPPREGGPPPHGPDRATVTYVGAVPAAWTVLDESGDVVRLAPWGLRVDPGLAGVARWQSRLATARGDTLPSAPGRDQSRRARPVPPVPLVPESWGQRVAELTEPVVTEPARERMFPATTELRLLGPWWLRTPGAVDEWLRPAVTDLLMAAALRPDGVPESEVPGLRTGPSRAELARLVHDWLGAAADGLPLLRPRGERWHLAPGARVDWHLFQAFTVPGGPGTERARLASALGLLAGVPFAGAPVGPATRRALRRHLAGLRATLRRCALRAAELAWRAGDLPAAEWSLRQGLAALPGEEELWRLLLSVKLAQDWAAACRVVDEMVVTLRTVRRSPRLRRATRDLLRRGGLPVPGRR